MKTDFNFELHPISNFRDAAACARVREITRDELTVHSNPDFNIRVVDKSADFYQQFATDIVDRIRAAREEQEQLVLILPAGPVPHYHLAADMINKERLSLSHVHTFNMDEYADENGNTAPLSWAGSFQNAMWSAFFSRIDSELRPPETQIHFPTTEKVSSYSQRLEDLGGAAACYGGIGWGGHIAFWEPHLADEFADEAAYRAAGTRLVDLHPMTVMQNALHSFSGDWSWVPPKANTIGPREIFGAKHRSFWLDGDLGNGYSWQQFIARLVAHGPVTPYVPGSLLQESRADFTILGRVADQPTIEIS